MMLHELSIGSFLDGVQHAVVVAEVSGGTIVHWNRKAGEIFGYPEAEALGMDVERLVPARHRGRYQAELARYRETGDISAVWSGGELSLPAVRRDGGEIYVELTLSPVAAGGHEEQRDRYFMAIVRDVTGHRRAKEEIQRLNEDLGERVATTGARLRESEERFRLLVGSLRDYAIFMVDPDGRITDWNVGAERIFGYREEEAVEKDFSIVFTPEDARQGVPEWELMQAESEGRAEDERWHVRKDGTRFWASGIVVPVRDEADNLRGFTKVARDLTERKLAAEALQRSEERLRVTFEQAAVGMAHVTPDGGRWLRANRKLCDIVGHPREELLGMSWDEIVHSDDVAADREQVRRLVDGEIDACSIERRCLRRDGSPVWVEFNVSLANEPSGEPAYLIVVAQDVTGREEAEARYRTLIENIPAVTYIQELVAADSNRASYTMYASPQIEAQLGYPPRAFEEDPELWIKRLHPDDRERVLAEDERTDATGEPFTMEYRQIARDGRVVWVRDHAVLARDEEGLPRFWQGVQLDVTESKRAEEQLRQSEERFRAQYRSFPVPTFSWRRVEDDFELVDYNDAADVITRGRAGEFLGTRASESYAGRPELLGMLWRCFDERVVVRDEIPWQMVTTSERKHFAVTFVRIPPDLVIHYAEDITERKGAEETLRESLGLVRSISEGTSDSIFRKDIDGRYLMVNSTASEILGRPVEEILGKTDEELHPPEVAASIAEVDRRVMEAGESVTVEEVLPVAGTMRTYLSTRTPYRDRRGNVAGLVGVSTDITDRKRAEENLAAITRQQAAVAELGLHALSGDDLRGLMEEAADCVTRTLGVEYCKIAELLPGGEELLLRAGVGWREGLVGNATERTGLDSQSGYTLVRSEPVILEDLEAETRFDPPALLREHGVVSGVTVLIPGRDGPFGVLGAHTSSRREFTGDDANFLQAVANVLAAAIERKAAQEELEGVREAERSRIARDLHDEALRDLTYALAEAQHVQSISSDPRPAHRLSRLVSALKRAGQHLRGAIYDLRLEGERERPFLELLESLVRLHRAMASDCEIRLEVRDGILSGPLGEKGRQLLRIIGEALTNARRHSGARNVRVAIWTSEERLWAEVEDDGRGFDPAKPSTAATGGGTGIRGMRERARVLGGDLEIESAPGGGARVRFEVALKEDSEESGEEAEAVRVLLVEDHASFREALASALARRGTFEIVGQAGSLAEARRALAEVRADVAVVDLTLPDGYGGDLIKELRQTNPHSQALVLSANLDRAEIARAVESGAAGVLHKSAGMDEVMDAVRRLRAGEMLLPLEEVVELLRFAGSQKDEAYEARQATALLTAREREVLQALAEGLDSREIARRLQISVKTERNHVSSIMAKLRVHSRLQALVVALRHGVVRIR